MQRLSMALCPACEHENEDAAQTCTACGSPLVMRCPACLTINVRTRSACHRCRAALRHEEATAPGPATGAAAPAAPEPEPAVELTLLADALDGRAPAYWGGAGGDAVPPPPVPAWSPGRDPTDLDWPALEADADRAAAASAAATGRAAPAPAAGDPPVPVLDRQRVKAERRAKVRQRQLRTQRAGSAAVAPVPVDLLVLDTDVDSRTAMCGVLEAFGFRIHLAADADETLALSLLRRYAAVLLGLGTPGVDTATLCHQLRRLPGFGATPVFAVGDAGHHAERVRMQLAGAADTLMRPVSRGMLAHTLYTHGVMLPRDPRVGAPPTS